MTNPETKIVISSKREKWRLECPEGHKNWRIWNGVFSCVTCHRHLEAGAADQSIYTTLVDRKTGRDVTREDIEIQEGAGQVARGD